MVGSEKRFFRFLILLLLAFQMACASGPKSPDESMGIRFNLKRWTLKNGLKVLIAEDHTVPVVDYQTWFKVGSVDEGLGSTGLAHLFEHLMFKGTEKYPSKEFFLQLQTKGAVVNAYTSRDYTVYHETFTPNLLDKVIDMESDRLANIKLDQEAFDTERSVVYEERRLRYDNSPGGKMQEALWQLAFKVHPYGWPVIGSMADLAQLRLEDLQEFFDNYYTPNNATIVVVGDVDAESTIKKIKKAYEGIDGHNRPKRIPPKEKEQTSERQLIMKDRVASERFMLGYRIVNAYHPDTYALDVLSNILFHGDSCRAHLKLVDKENLVFGVDGFAYTPAYDGLFLISANMLSQKKASQAIKSLDELFKEVIEKGVTQEEVKAAVKQLKVQIVDSLRTSKGKADMIGTVEMILGKAEDYHEEVDRYLKVTPQDVQRVAQKYLQPERRSVVVMKPGVSESTEEDEL